MKVQVAPAVLGFASAIRDSSPTHHPFGWLIGVTSVHTVTVLGALHCIHYGRKVISSSNDGFSEPDYAKERSSLDALLPVGVSVVGCFFAHDCSGPMQNALSRMVTEFGVEVDGKHFLVASLAMKDLYAANEARDAVAWRWAQGESSPPVISIDAGAVKRFRASHVLVSMSCNFAPGHNLSDLDTVMLQMEPGGKLLDPLSKQQLETVFPAKGDAVSKDGAEYGLDLSRRIRVLRRHAAGYDLMVPQLIPASGNASLARLDATTIGYFALTEATTVATVCTLLVDKLNRIEWLWRLSGTASASETAFFQPPGVALAVMAYQLNGETPQSTRTELTRRLGLPLGRIYFRSANRIDRVWIGPLKILDVHVDVLENHSVKGAVVHTIEGHYEYCHYMQDKFNDDGWGCAYRSLQTISSWLRLQGYASGPAASIRPTHRFIQETLVKLGDKEAAFVGSKNWIGAVEIGMILGEWYGIDCRTIHVASGGQVGAHVPDLVRHFKEEKSPIMIGGGVLAWTLLGVAVGEREEDTRYLILDPHYTGEDDRKVIQKKGWISWKPPSVFRKDSFYNFCCPIVPKE